MKRRGGHLNACFWVKESTLKSPCAVGLQPYDILRKVKPDIVRTSLDHSWDRAPCQAPPAPLSPSLCLSLEKINVSFL